MDNESKDKTPSADALKREVFERLLAERGIVLPTPIIPKRNSAGPMPASQKRLWDGWLGRRPNLNARPSY